MNWYNLYKFAYNVSKDDILARKLSQDIFLIVKDNLGKDTYREIKVDDKCTLQLYFSFKDYQNNKLRYDTFDIEGFSDSSKIDLFNPYIRIALYFSNDFSDKYFESLIYVLYDTVKHELGHYKQYKNKENHEYIDSNDFDNINPLEPYINRKNYILSSGEIIPYIRGLVFTSKKQNIPLDVIIDKNIDGIFFLNNIESKKEILNSVIGKEVENIILDIKNMVISKAKEIYPYLRKQL